MPNFVSFAASIAQLAHGEKLHTQSRTQSLTQLTWCPGNRSGTHLHIKNEVCMSVIQKLQTEQDTQTWYFAKCDLDVDPINLIYAHDLDILNMYTNHKNL